MKRILWIGILSFFLTACGGSIVHRINFSSDYAPDKIKRLAILHFNVPDHSSMRRDIMSDKFTTALLGTSFKLVDRTDIKKLMAEANFQNLAEGIIDERTKEKLRHLGADSILTGSLQTYTDKRGANDINLVSEVYLTAKVLKVETGEVLWSAEIMKQSKAKNVGQKKFIGGESEAVAAGKLLDDIVQEMADSFKEKKGMEKYLNFIK
ncbi:MAG: CsgG/HfaB family protein [Syntrophales bacterium]|nr:CsgG/HfaB family protein [Syntrophales bacterium]